MKSKKLSIVTAFIISTSLFLCFTSDRIGLNNSIYAVEQLHAYDNGLFLGNPAIMFGEKTPRFFMNWLFQILMRTFSWPWENVAMLITYLGVLPYSFGAVNAVWRMYDKNRLLYTVFLTVFVARGITSGFPGWTTFEPDVLGLGIAFGFSFAAISFVIGSRKNWALAWVMASVSMFLHVHEGVWGCAALFLLWLTEAIDYGKLDFKRFKAFPVFIISTAVCILPSLATSAGTLTDREFVRIYANIRTPHHLVPSSWGGGLFFRIFYY